MCSAFVASRIENEEYTLSVAHLWRQAFRTKSIHCVACWWRYAFGTKNIHCVLRAGGVTN